MFTKHRVATLAATGVMTVSLGLASVLSAAIAAATPVDDRFLADLTAGGIGFHSPADAIADAHTICGAVAEGESPVSLYQVMLKNSGMTPDHAALFVVASVNEYCPAYSSRLPS
jgi:hypothetical protein